MIIRSLDELQDLKTLLALISHGEGPSLEFKSQLLGELELAILIAAFANAGGGLLLFGIGEDARIVGIRNPSHFTRVITKAANLVRPRIEYIERRILDVGAVQIGSVLIPSGGQDFISVNGDYYHRIGATNVRLSSDEIQIISAKRETATRLVLTNSDLERFLQLIDEDTFTQVLLVPLLRSLGFRSVSAKGHKDRTLEYGQDIRNFKLQLPTGHWLYFAAQVKTGDIHYSSAKPDNNIESILTQVMMALGKKMFDVETSQYHLPVKILFVASGHIVEGARQYLYERLSEDRSRKFLFWDRDLIIEKSTEIGLPEGIQIEIRKHLAASSEEATSNNA